MFATVVTMSAIIFVLVAVCLFGVRRDQAWLTPAAIVCAIGLLVALNLANPQRRIAENNLDRNEEVLVWHVRHGQFNGDGRATLADNLDRLSPELATEVQTELCLRYGIDTDGDGLLDLNVGRRKASDAIDRLCG